MYSGRVVWNGLADQEVNSLIYTEQQLIEILERLIKTSENEVIEFKEASNKYKFNDIGQYFSALSNEANLRGLHEAWLVFGVEDKTKEICGTHFYEQGNPLPGLKKDIANHTNNGLGFKEIYEIEYKNKRVIMFQIPPAIPGIPTTWDKAAFSREGESLAPLPMDKMEEIKQQKGFDWSKQIVEEAVIEDLDPEAIVMARKQFKEKNGRKRLTPEILDGYSDIEFLDKAGLTIRGKITNAALVLLGKDTSSIFFDGFSPRITWSLYNSEGLVKTYEHFDMPMILAVEEVLKSIRNVTYRYIPSQNTLFPEEVYQYDSDLLRELLHNCIAHQDYTLRGKINVEEFEDSLIFINEGSFIPETIEAAMEQGYKPPYYRNDFLCRAMVNLNMIDTNAMGIPRIFKIQRDRYFPLPTYDLDKFNRVSVTVYGKILDKNYTTLLYEDKSLDIRTVFLLDRIQKKMPITKDEYQDLKGRGLAEGRYPNIYVSLTVADVVGGQAQYIRNKGLKNTVYKQLILETLETQGQATQQEILEVLKPALSDVLDDKKKRKKVTNLLQAMKNTDKSVYNKKIEGRTVWVQSKK